MFNTNLNDIPKYIILDLDNEVNLLKNNIIDNINLPTADLAVCLEQLINSSITYHNNANDSHLLNSINDLITSMSKGEYLYENARLSDDDRKIIYNTLKEFSTALITKFTDYGIMINYRIPYNFKRILHGNGILLMALNTH